MALTNNPEIAHKIELLRSHGITRDAERFQYEPDGPWYYEQLALGFNYRMTDIQAALGVSQISRLAEFIDRRRNLAARYDELLAEFPLQLPWQHPEASSAWHLYVVRLPLESVEQTRLQAFNSLRELGIGVNVHYIPIYRQPFYQKIGYDAGRFPNAEAYYRSAITLPIFAGLTNEQQDLVIGALGSVLR